MNLSRLFFAGGVVCGLIVLHPGQGTIFSQESLPSCEWCGAAEAPSELSWNVTIAGKDEPGEHLLISGTVYQPDGMTPASGVILYLYHTNASGVYPKRGDERGNGRRHGYLRGWLKTQADGRYRFATIKPASYPNGTEPAHIHAVVLAQGRGEYWIDSFLFEGDPVISDSLRNKLENRGGSGIVRLKRNADGAWEGKRDITLMSGE